MKYKYCCPDVCSQCIQLNAKYLVLLSVAIPMATRAIIGPLTFYPTFVATESFKVTRAIQQIIAIAYQLVSLGDLLNIFWSFKLLRRPPASLYLGLQARLDQNATS